MGKVEILINEEGALKVVQHYDLRVLLRRLRPEGFERHRVVKWPNCSCSPGSTQEDKFNCGLKVFFLYTICLAIINIFVFQNVLHSEFHIGWKGIVPLVMFAAGIAVSVLVAMKNTGSASPRRKEVQTISALVEKV